MRIRRETRADDFLPEVVEVLLREPALEERARVDAGRRVALEVDEVAAVLRRRRAPEMIEADLVERGRRRVARDVAAVLRALAIRVHDHRERVPADVRLDAPLDRPIARVVGLLADRDRVQVRRVRAIRQIRAGAARVIDHAFEEDSARARRRGLAEPNRSTRATPASPPDRHRRRESRTAGMV